MAWPHLAVVVVVTAMVAAQAPADEEPGEEDHRDDEQDPGHDADPRQRLVEPGHGALIIYARPGMTLDRAQTLPTVGLFVFIV